MSEEKAVEVIEKESSPEAGFSEKIQSCPERVDMFEMAVRAYERTCNELGMSSVLNVQTPNGINGLFFIADSKIAEDVKHYAAKLIAEEKELKGEEQEYEH